MTKPYLQLTSQQKRQAVLDLLNARGGMVFSDIKAALQANDSLSSVLNVMAMRGEIAKGRRVTGNQFEWQALVDTTAAIRMGPTPADSAPPEDPPRPAHIKLVKLLDKPNRIHGGQGAIHPRPGIQSGMQITMEAA